MKPAAHDLAIQRVSSYVEALGYEQLPDWLITALGVVAWTRSGQWKLDASEAETTMIRRACKKARDYLTKKPPDIDRARACLAFLRLKL